MIRTPSPSVKEPGTRSRQQLFTVPILLSLLSIIFFVHFRQPAKLGLYEDDYWSIAPSLGAPISQLGHMAVKNFLTWPQGRPLNHFMPPALSTLGSSVGGLPFVYVLACLWLTFNTLLVFRLLSKLLSRQAALFGALLYALFPADCTRILLTHVAHVQGSMTYLLLALNLFVSPSRIRFLAYPMASLSLLSYETAFLPFIVAPFLMMKPTRKWWIGLFTHGLLCGLIIGSVALVRISLHETRALESIQSPSETLWHMLSSLWMGPSTLVLSFWQALSLGFGKGFIHTAAIACAAAVAFAILARRLDSRRHMDNDQPTPLHPEKSFLSLFITDAGPTALGLACIGALTACWSYILTITNYPPTNLLGRLTSVHTAAAWGTALVGASLFQIVANRGLRLQPALIGVGAAIVFVLANYGCFIERSYVKAWEYQRQFWRELAMLTPDLNAQTAVIVVEGRPRQNQVILSNSWADYLVVRQLVPLPYSPTILPFCVLLENTQVDFQVIDGQIWWKPDPTTRLNIKLDEENVILLRCDGKNLTRIDHWTVPAIDRQLHSRPQGADTGFWKDLTHLGRRMFGRKGIPVPEKAAPQQ